jgi:hypothetical protein
MHPKVFDAMVLSYPSIDQQLAVGLPVAAQPKIYEGAAYPTPTIISGSLSIEAPAIEGQIVALDQKISAGINSVSSTTSALGLLGLLNTAGDSAAPRCAHRENQGAEGPRPVQARGTLGRRRRLGQVAPGV